MIAASAWLRALMVVLVTGCGASHSPSPPFAARHSARPPASAPCRTPQLAIALTHTGAVMGELGGYLRFTNRGPGTCRLSGWPTVIALDAALRGIPARRAVHGMMLGGWLGPRSLPVLELPPGTSGYAVVAAGDVPGRGVRPCAHYRWLDIAPPGDARHVTVSAWLPDDDAYLPACLAFNRKPDLQVSAVVPRSALPH